MEDQTYYFNLEETQKVNDNPIYKNYKKWLQQNGVIVDPAIVYPAYFGDKNTGVIGVATSKPLPPNHTILAVPYNLIITVDKVKQVPELNKIILENPSLFKIHNDSAFGILALYVCYEMMKKEKSFYAPYFAVADDISLTNWSHWEIRSIQNMDIAALMRKQKDDIERHFIDFLTVFRTNPTIFPQEISNMEYMKIFERAFNFICTRAFGWSLPSISMIPMADSLNHNNDYVTHMLVDTKLQINPHQMYKPKHQRISLSLLSNFCKQIPQKPLPERKKPRIQKFVNKHKQILQDNKPNNPQQTILYQQYKAEVRNLRQLHFYESSCEEDNDTDEEYIEKFQFDLEKFRFYEKYESLGINQKNKVEQLTRYWKIYLDPVFDEYVEEQNQAVTLENAKKRDPKLIKEDYDKFGKQSEGSSLVSSSSSEDSDDQQFKWMAANPDSHSHQSTFFIMATRKPAKKNQQLYNFYGRRSNRFLLVGYNFILQENKYDSFAFRLCIDDWDGPKPFSTKIPTSKIIYLQNEKKKKMSIYFTKQLRVKKQRVCIQLINHCRALLIGFGEKVQMPENTRVLIMIPFNLQFEKKVLALASEFLKTLLSNYMTTNEEDEQLLEKCHKYQGRIAIEMRMSHKEIIQAQIKIIDKCQGFLKIWKNGKLNLSNQSDMKWVRKTRQYLCSLERGKL